MWIRKEGAFTGVVPVATFMTAQEILAERLHDGCPLSAPVKLS